jgi:hypothetical protein
MISPKCGARIGVYKRTHGFHGDVWERVATSAVSGATRIMRPLSPPAVIASDTHNGPASTSGENGKTMLQPPETEERRHAGPGGPGSGALPGTVLVRNHYSLISAGTEGSTVKAARSSLLEKPRRGPSR